MKLKTVLLAALVLAVTPAVSYPATHVARTDSASQPRHERHIVATIISIQGLALVIQKRNGKLLDADLSLAQADGLTGALPFGVPVAIYGFRKAGVFHITRIGHAGPTLNDNGPDDDP